MLVGVGDGRIVRELRDGIGILVRQVCRVQMTSDDWGALSLILELLGVLELVLR